MTDLEVMQRAKTYIDKLANGINPLDDTTLLGNDIVNNVRISRCLFYVSDVLRQVIENGGLRNLQKASYIASGFNSSPIDNSVFNASIYSSTI